MSWRTQSQYLGLDDSDRAWLKDFDRSWDTKAEGRSRVDTLENIPCLSEKQFLKYVAPETNPSDRVALESSLINLASKIARITVPRAMKSGWSIHLVMKCGRRSRARFDDEDSAAQAYYALKELSFWFPET